MNEFSWNCSIYISFWQDVDSTSSLVTLSYMNLASCFKNPQTRYRHVATARNRCYAETLCRYWHALQNANLSFDFGSNCAALNVSITHVPTFPAAISLNYTDAGTCYNWTLKLYLGAVRWYWGVFHLNSSTRFIVKNQRVLKHRSYCWFV